MNRWVPVLKVYGLNPQCEEDRLQLKHLKEWLRGWTPRSESRAMVTSGVRTTFSRTCGCSCGCSPGFIVCISISEHDRYDLKHVCCESDRVGGPKAWRRKCVVRTLFMKTRQPDVVSVDRIAENLTERFVQLGIG